MLIRDVCSHAACSLERSGTVVAKGRGWTEGVEARGLSEQTGTDPFLLQLLRQASEGLFLHSLRASSGSFSAECFEVALFSCVHNWCSFAAKAFSTGDPHCSVTDQRSRRATVLLWVSLVLDRHNITVLTPDFRM